MSTHYKSLYKTYTHMYIQSMYMDLVTLHAPIIQCTYQYARMDAASFCSHILSQHFANLYCYIYLCIVHVHVYFSQFHTSISYAKAGNWLSTMFNTGLPPGFVLILPTLLEVCHYASSEILTLMLLIMYSSVDLPVFFLFFQSRPNWCPPR